MKNRTFEIVLASPAAGDTGAFSPSLEGVCDRFVHWPERKVRRFERLMAVCGSYPASTITEGSVLGRRAVATEIARGVDIVVVDYPHAARMLPRLPPLASVLFTHNIEAEILERHAEVASGLSAMVWRREASKMRKFEARALRQCDTVIAVSDRDATALRQRYHLQCVETIDTGVDLGFYGFDPPSGQDRRTVVFCGAMDSRSNIDGISFLMNDVWPLLVEIRPDASMIVVGRNPPDHLVKKAAARGMRWSFTGTVSDVRPHVLAGDVAVMPLRVGSGTRLKAFESMALGRPVVSTRLGVEGLSLTLGQHYLAADSAQEFARAVATLLDDAAERSRIALNARRLLEERYSWSRVGRQFETICRETLARRRGHELGEQAS